MKMRRWVAFMMAFILTFSQFSTYAYAAGGHSGAVEEHTHNEDGWECEETVVSKLVCGLEDHEHTDECYVETSIWKCTAPEKENAFLDFLSGFFSGPRIVNSPYMVGSSAGPVGPVASAPTVDGESNESGGPGIVYTASTPSGPSTPSQIEDKKNSWKIPTVTVTIGDTVYEDSDTEIEYPVGEDITVRFEWNIEDGIPLEDFVYDLRDFLCEGQTSITLYDANGKPIAKCTVEEKNHLRFEFLDEDFKNGAVFDRSFYVELTGPLKLDPSNADDREKDTIMIGHKEFDLTQIFEDAGVKANKKMSNIVMKDGRFVSTVTITLEIKDKVEKIELEDVMNEGLEWVESSLAVSYKEDDGTIKDIFYTISRLEDESENKGFKFISEGPYIGGVITITYEVEITSEGILTIAKPSDALKNAINVEYGIEGEYAYDSAKPKWIEPSIKKSGVIKDGYIEWTITFNTGSLGNIFTWIQSENSDVTKGDFIAALKDVGILDEEGKLNLQFDDTLGDGLVWDGELDQKLTEDILDKWYKHTVDHESKKGTSGEDAYIYEYTYTYTTSIEEVERDIYSNNISFSFGNGVWGGSSSAKVGVGDYEFKKDFEGLTDENLMNWKIETRLPQKEYQTFVITDSPQNDTENKKDYAHKYVKGTIKVTVGDTEVYSIPAESDRVTVNGEIIMKLSDQSLSGGGLGFKLTIYGTTEWAQAHDGQLIYVTFQTEAVDVYFGKNEGSLEGTYKWVNNADLSIDNVIKKDDNAETSNTGVPLLEKKGSVENGIFTWRLDVGMDPFFKVENGALSGWYNSLQVTLNDTLPQNHVYIEDSAYVTLSINKGSWPTAWKNIRPQLEQILSQSQYFKVDSSNENVLKFTWDGNGLDNSLAEIEADIIKACQSIQPSPIILEIVYQTIVDDSDEVAGADGVLEYVNTVSGTINGKPMTTFVRVFYTPSDTLTKTCIYDDNMADRFAGSDWLITDGKLNAYYEIDINPGKLTFEGELILEDEMGSSLTPILDSLQLKEVETGRVLDRNEYYMYYDHERNLLTLKFPDGVHYKLSYWASLAEEAGTAPKSARNSVVLKAETTVGSSITKPIQTVLKLNGGASYTKKTYEFTVYKYTHNESIGMDFLSGAEFSLVAVQYQNGTFVEVGDPIDGEIIDKGETFTFQILANADVLNHIFKLTEIKAPAGYAIAAQPYYFVFQDHSEGLLNDLPDEVKAEVLEFDINKGYYFENSPIDPDMTSLTVKKAWKNDTARRRPQSVTVQLYKNDVAEGGAVTLNEANGWTYTWHNLDTESTWSVDEVKVPSNYTKSVTHSGTTWTITNTYRSGGNGDYPSSRRDPEDPTDPTNPTNPETPTQPGDQPQTPNWPAELPDPNDPNTPSPITIIDENGVPRTYYKVWDDDLGQYVWILDEDLPLGFFDVPSTGDDRDKWLMLILASLSGASLVGLTHKRKSREL